MATRNVEPFTHGETEALQTAHGKLDGAALLDAYASLDEENYFQHEGYEKALRTLVTDLPGSVARRLDRGDLDGEKAARLLGLVSRGSGWPELIIAASRYMSEDDLMSAVYDATFPRGTFTGSRVPVSERQRDFFEELAKHPNQLVASIGRRIAEYYRREVERTRREEFREQYER